MVIYPTRKNGDTMYNDERRNSQFNKYLPLLYRHADAKATITGSDEYSQIQGLVNFYQTEKGVLIGADITGLPVTSSQKRSFFGFHIHEGMSCTGDEADPFAEAGLHYNPGNVQHPYHAGDLPPLLGNNGNAFSIFLTNAFHLEDVIGRTIIIHSQPDDFTSQPAGNSGIKIACGKIMK